MEKETQLKLLLKAGRSCGFSASLMSLDHVTSLWDLIKEKGDQVSLADMEELERAVEARAKERGSDPGEQQDESPDTTRLHVLDAIKDAFAAFKAHKDAQREREQQAAPTQEAETSQT